MAKSSSAAALLLALVPAAADAAAGPVTAEEAIEQQRRQVEDAAGTGPCRTGAAEDEIVVCGREEVERVDYPPVPGERRRLIAGEPPSGAAALNAGARGGGGIDLIKLGRAVKKGLEKVF